MTENIKIIYASGSSYKKEELDVICEMLTVPSGEKIGSVFAFEMKQVRPLNEILVRDLEEFIKHKARSAYRQLLMPCIVEHGGLIFHENVLSDYPGGLTQPMWDALGASAFIRETNLAGKRVINRAVIGYCDGTSIMTFTGDRHGRISHEPRGNRAYYWDPIFIPDRDDGGEQNLTYAEISDKCIADKVCLSQSTAALKQFFEYRLKIGPPPLFKNILPNC